MAFTPASSHQGGAVQFMSTPVSAAEIAALDATAKVLLPAPGGRNYYVLHGVVLHYRFVTSAYAGSDAGSLVVGYNTVVADLGTTMGLVAPCGSGGGGGITPGALLQQTADAYAIATVASVKTMFNYEAWTAVQIENVPLTLGNIGTAYSGGDSTLVVRTFYTLIDGAS